MILWNVKEEEEEDEEVEEEEEEVKWHKHLKYCWWMTEDPGGFSNEEKAVNHSVSDL